MPLIIDFTLARAERGTLTVPTTPPTAIGGWSMQYQMTKRLGGTPIVTKYMASGFYGVSGMNILDSGQGTFSVALDPADVSGFDPGAYSYNIQRTDSGFPVVTTEGHRLMNYP